VQFELVCPSSDEAVRRDDPANAGYSRRAIVERLDKLRERGHTYEVVYTDSFRPRNGRSATTRPPLSSPFERAGRNGKASESRGSSAVRRRAVADTTGSKSPR
jgi:hypothetical protein